MKVLIKGNPRAFLNQVNDSAEEWTASEDQMIQDMARAFSDPWKEMVSKLRRLPSTCLGRYEELVKGSDCVAPKRRTSAPKGPVCKRSKMVGGLSQANLEQLEQQVKEKDERIQYLQKMLDNMQSQLQAYKEKERQASIVELTSKHQKQDNNNDK